MKRDDRLDLLNNLSKGQISFSTSDTLGKCSFEEVLIIEKKIDINTLDTVIEKSIFKILKNDTNGFVLFKFDGMDDKLIKIEGSNGKGLISMDGIHFIKDYKNLYFYRYELDAYEIIGESLDIKSLIYVGSNYYKDIKGIYYIAGVYEGGFVVPKITKLKTINLNSFKLINDYGGAEDDNYLYNNGFYTNKNIFKLKSRTKFFKDLILSKKALENSTKGEMFKGAVDKRVSSLDDFHNLLGKMDLDSTKYRKYKLVLEYMKAKIGVEIWKRDGIEKESI